MKSEILRPAPRQVENSSEGRSVFVSRRPFQPLSRPACAGFRERRAAPFRVCAKRPTRCPQTNHEAKRPARCHQKTCGRDHESRRRRAPAATNAPCGRHETYPASRQVTKALRPAIDLQAFPNAHFPKALFAVSSACRGKPGIHRQKTMDSRQRPARVGVARWRVGC